MVRMICASLILGAAFLITTLLSGIDAESAAREKWIVVMDFCKESMVGDVKEEISAGKSEFNMQCRKAGMKKAVDVRCSNGKLEVKCR